MLITRMELAMVTIVIMAPALPATPEPPAWLTSTVYDDYGTQDRVLLPWTPVEWRGNAAYVWGREIRWGAESILPSSITSSGAELLAEPMRLIVRVGGADHAVPLDDLQLAEARRSRVTLRAKGSVAGVRVEAEMWVEYDGFLWLTLRTYSDIAVESLRIEAAMPVEEAVMYQTFSRPLMGFLSSDTIKLPWMANSAEHIVNFYHWLGNEERGLGFTYSSLQHWAPQSEDNFCTIVPGHDRVIYRINLVEKPLSLEGRQFQLGIQATPIKPLPPDYHSMVSAAAHWAPWKAWMQVPEDIDTMVLWPPGLMRGLNDPYNCNAETMSAQVAELHKRGLAVLFTGCPQKISPLSEEFEEYRAEWLTEPESVLDWEGVPHYQNCGRSYTLRKWLFHGWTTEIVKRFGLDGIYWDGWMTGQIACHNERHGCGWTDGTGQRHLTVPVLEGREFNQRLAAWLEDNVQSPYIPPKAAPQREGFPRYEWRIHSWEFVPPLMGFGTSWLTGEFAAYPLQGPSMLTPEGTLGKSMGLALLRTRCLSTNWGVPNLFHVMMWEHTEDHPTDRQTLDALAWLLPHGVPLGELGYMNQKTVTEILRIMVGFGTRRAQFTPAWRVNPWFDVEGGPAEEVLVATWDHRMDREVLAVVSNLSVEQTRDVTLRWKGFDAPEVRDARTGEALQMENAALALRLGPEEFVLLRVSAAP